MVKCYNIYNCIDSKETFKSIKNIICIINNQ